MKRNRVHYTFYILITIAIGLFSRSSWIPELIYPYLGDVLYALMFYFIIGWLFPRMEIYKVALYSIAFCFLIEISQLCQADWLNNIRAYQLGSLILGKGFLWSDLLCYMLGGGLGALIEKRLLNIMFVND